MNRKVGRPKKAEKETYSEKVGILLTKKEKILIERKAREEDISVNKFLRNIIFSNLS